MKSRLSLSLLFIIFGVLAVVAEDKRFVVLVASYNNSKWYKENLKSILDQSYRQYRIVYVDDYSSDKTANLVETFLKERKVNYNKLTIHYNDNLDLLSTSQYVSFLSTLIKAKQKNCKFLLVRNEQRKFALHNLIMAIYACGDREIVVEVDGDDFLAHSNVLKKLNDVYNIRNVWLTYGQFKNLSNGRRCSWNMKIPDSVVVARSIRKYPHLPTHLRTFYAGLFKKIKLEDLVFEGGFYKMTWDVAFMLPMIEIAADKFHYISEPLLIYNDLNDINDHKVDGKLQMNLSKLIRRQPRYESAEKL